MTPDSYENSWKIVHKRGGLILSTDILRSWIIITPEAPLDPTGIGVPGSPCEFGGCLKPEGVWTRLPILAPEVINLTGISNEPNHYTEVISIDFDWDYNGSG